MSKLSILDLECSSLDSRRHGADSEPVPVGLDLLAGEPGGGHAAAQALAALHSRSSRPSNWLPLLYVEEVP